MNSEGQNLLDRLHLAPNIAMDPLQRDLSRILLRYRRFGCDMTTLLLFVTVEPIGVARHQSSSIATHE